jgi:hypothetical protein
VALSNIVGASFSVVIQASRGYPLPIRCAIGCSCGYFINPPEVQAEVERRIAAGEIVSVGTAGPIVGL